METITERTRCVNEVRGCIYMMMLVACCLHQKYTSTATITWRKKKLGLKGSSITTKSIPDIVKRQMVLDQMAKDPTRMQGPWTVKEGIAHDMGEQITWCVPDIEN